MIKSLFLNLNLDKILVVFFWEKGDRFKSMMIDLYS